LKSDNAGEGGKITKRWRIKMRAFARNPTLFLGGRPITLAIPVTLELEIN
jgi:hypothetical protein